MHKIIKKTERAGAEICVPQYLAKGWGGKQDTFRPRLLNCGYNQSHKTTSRCKMKHLHLRIPDLILPSGRQTPAQILRDCVKL